MVFVIPFGAYLLEENWPGFPYCIISALSTMGKLCPLFLETLIYPRSVGVCVYVCVPNACPF